jgi:hypothetical protein
MLKIVRMFKIRKISKEIEQMLATMELLMKESHDNRMMARDYEFWGKTEEARKARCEAIKREKEFHYYDEEIDRLYNERWDLQFPD